MRVRGAGVLLIVAMAGRLAAGREPIPLPVPDGPTLTILPVGDTSPITTPKEPPLPPVPSVIPPVQSVLPPATSGPGPSVLTGNPMAVAPDESIPLFMPPWHPEPPPATYSTSGCNFNVWCGNELFSPDFSTVQILAGDYTTRSGFGPKVPRFEYQAITYRAGFMLNAPQDTDAFWRGNMEVLGDITAGRISSGYGNYLVSPALIGRYNFVQPNASLIPYLQIGGGFAVTDASKDKSQNAIGQQFNARLFAGAGVHCLVHENLFLDIEGGYSSISNLGLADRGAGVHTLGIQVGLTYFFRSGGR
ncbi:acyloxyacyl hydrolase [Zavarzinella formosa]|uniref:acyloxyacyl hydrolase n=1 Tax=Zavarzinella formosa TaxID=360055 RepID=UPI0002D94F33|nr:acyloxyacyl hydrolase [Zavarzinella formosa]